MVEGGSTSPPIPSGSGARGAESLPGKSARRLIRAATRASLATTREDGSPYASLVLAACDHDASPLLLLSRLAEHSRNLERDPRLSLLFDGTAGFEDPLAGPRLTLLGRAVESDEPRHRRRFLRRHPASAPYAGFSDFRIRKVAVARAHFVLGFGEVLWLAAEDVLYGSDSRELVEDEDELILQANRDCARAILDLARRRGLAPPCEIVALDHEGCDLRAAGTLVRIEFPEPVEDARAALAAIENAAKG